MKISVQPGKRRNGSPRSVFDSQLAADEIASDQAGGVAISILCQDIYTPNASQRYLIQLSATEVEAILAVLKGNDPVFGLPSDVPTSSVGPAELNPR
jgi:hypothetical protein